jgi:pimeloyl-ACP methyl ester carboxylesterase
MGTVTFRKVNVEGIGIFYREAGPKDAPTILLLHGFPTAGHMFRDLISQLDDEFRLVAPDLPGFGQSDMPARSAFIYTFENIAKVIERFTEVIGLQRFAMYVFDYGAPVGFRLAVRIWIASPQSSPRTATRMRRGSATAGIPFAPIGETRRHPTERRSEAFSLPRRRAGSTHTVSRT